MSESNSFMKKAISGFTIVELLIVIVVIAILASISVVTYNGVQSRARGAAASTGLVHAREKLDVYAAEKGKYPTTGNLNAAEITDDDVNYQYTSDGTTYCITGTVDDVAYYATNTASPSEGICDGHTAPTTGGGSTIATGDPIQTVTSANCPADRTMTVDARDNHTYWVQKLDDGKCWMLTNLAYAGGGTNTYGDVKEISQGAITSWTMPYYYVHTSANPTTSPTQPNSSTTGAGQYGYLYNLCAALGAQSGTHACSNESAPASDPSVSICPSGWRIPTANGGEFSALNTVVNSGSSSNDAGLRSTWLAQLGGAWLNNFTAQGTTGYYWSSTPSTATSAYALSFSSTGVNPATELTDYIALSVRCVAN